MPWSYGCDDRGTRRNGYRMNLPEFLDSDRETVFLDGAMGTQLGEAGLEMGAHNNVTHPEAVLAVHERYAECGVDLLITNTLTMNRVNIESHNIDVDVREVNLAGVRLAKEAARDGQYVLGDMSSTGKMLKPYGPLAEDDAYAAFREQASILAEGGVDGLIIETMFDLREALCALRAAKEAADLPVIVSIAFNTAGNGGRTVMGNTACDCAQALAEAGAYAVGANCGSLDPLELAEVVAMMREATSLPIVAQPNAGKARLVEKRLIFDMPPSSFAAGIEECVRAGARLVGGCCGTSPAHIKAMVELLAQTI
jgi:5-methyltetrahydrofolate--homocysteine methyltransferase